MGEPELQEKAQQIEPKRWRFTILHSFALVVLLGIIQLWLYFVINKSTGLKFEDLRWYHLCVLNGVSGGITLAVGAYLNGFSLHSMLLDHLPDVTGILGAILAMVGISIISSELNNVLHRFFPIPPQTDLIKKFFEEDLIGVFLTVMIVAPIVEELLFRGVILDGLRMHYRLATAVMVSSVLFGLVHIDLYIAVNAFLLGLFLAWVRLNTGSLMLCVIGHATFNAIPFVVVRILKMEIPGFTTPPSGAVQFQPLWFDALGVFLLVGGIAALNLANQKRDQVIPEDQGVQI